MLLSRMCGFLLAATDKKEAILNRVACLVLCLCLLSLSGCFDNSPQSIDYKKAEAAFNAADADYTNLKKAAQIFESLGEYKDAAQRSRECWTRYGTAHRQKGYVTPSLVLSAFANKNYPSRLPNHPDDVRYSSFDVDKRLMVLAESKDAQERAGEHPEAKSDLNYIAREMNVWQLWKQARPALEREAYAEAIPPLEALSHERFEEKPARQLLSIAQRRVESQAMTKRFQAYLDGVPGCAFTPDPTMSFDRNLNALFASDPIFKNNPEMIAGALAGMRCYPVIATGLNALMPFAKRKLPNGSMAIHTGLAQDTLLVAMIKLAESGDDSPEFNELLSLLHTVVVSPNVHATRDDPFRRYAKLLELYKGGPEWIDRCFPDDSELRDYKIQGTMDYRVVHAPQKIKDALCDEAKDLPGSRFIRTYTAQEAKKLFANFTPSKPLKFGYLYIIDQGVLPKRTLFPPHRLTGYESPPRSVEILYEPENPSLVRRDLVQRDGGSVQAKETILQKGEYFCVANPNNARLAIYEKYSYQHRGTYIVQGRQDRVDVYTPTIEIRIVDLVTGKTLSQERLSADAKASYQVPNSVKQGDTFIPFNFFDREGYLSRKLDGRIK